jgi:archaellum component FlaG (FlaF/FlaG flagellin family)
MILFGTSLYAQSYNRLLIENDILTKKGTKVININFHFDIINESVTIKRNGVETKLPIYLKELGNEEYDLIQCKEIIFLLEIKTGNVIALIGNQKYTFYNKIKKI